ncbi:MAG: hypothetical protein Q9163_002223 [Psora crenata]
METNFISIHDLSLDARLLYVSSSIEDILGYSPVEVVGRSCWEYFHPDEIPFAQAIHGRSIQLDKAAVLRYCRIKNRDGIWVGCECVFTVVHDCLVASTSIYRGGKSSQRRAKDAPVVRQLFSSSPRDPRYHMLQYISAKFSQNVTLQPHEPRAALFLNRFSRTLTIMFATNGLADVLGITNDQLTGKSFYYCIQENCLREAVKCLESAKANDSIAYLRFWFRDPRQDDFPVDRDEHMSDGHSSGDEGDGGVHLAELMDHDGSENAVTTGSSNSMRSSVERDPHPRGLALTDVNSRSSSGNSADLYGNSVDAIFDRPEGGQQSSTSSISTPDEPRASGDPWSPRPVPVELEAVVSCTSDGLVVVLRRARPLVPHVSAPMVETPRHPYANGLFASPWANDPILPNMQQRAINSQSGAQPTHPPATLSVQQANGAANQGPAAEDFMNSIREVAVFAWSLTGINGSLAQYCRGTPSGESQPDTFQVWDPYSNAGPERERRNNFMDHAPGRSQQVNSQNTGQSINSCLSDDGRQRYSYATGLPAHDLYDSSRGYGNHVTGDGTMQRKDQSDGFIITEQNGHIKTAQTNHPHYFGSHSDQANGPNGSEGVPGPSPLPRQQHSYEPGTLPDRYHGGQIP